MNNFEIEQKYSLEEQSDFYIKLHKILTKESDKISIKNGYNFVMENLELFNEVEDLIYLNSEMISANDKKFKKVLSLFEKGHFTMAVSLIQNKINKDKAQAEKEKESKETLELINSYKKKINTILDGKELLSNDNINLQRKLESKNEIIKKQSKTIKDNIPLLVKANELDEVSKLFHQEVKNSKMENQKTILELTQRLIDTVNAYQAYITNLEKKNILVRVNNSKNKLPEINSTALDAVSGIVIHKSTTSTVASNNDEYNGTKIIKVGEQANIQNYTLKDIQEGKLKEKEIREFLEDVKRLQDRNKELEEKLKEKEKIEIELKQLNKKYEELEKEKTKIEKRNLELEDIILENKIQTNGLVKKELKTA